MSGEVRNLPNRNGQHGIVILATGAGAGTDQCLTAHRAGHFQGAKPNSLHKNMFNPHPGDLPNLLVDGNGKATISALEYANRLIDLEGGSSVIGRTLAVYKGREFHQSLRLRPLNTASVRGGPGSKPGAGRGAERQNGYTHRLLRHRGTGRYHLHNCISIHLRFQC